MQEIYLDNAATTRVDVDIAQVALQIMTQTYANPSSLHQKGIEAGRMLENARRTLGNVLGCTQEEVFFTSGGTESNNLALLGAANALRRRGKSIVVSAFEHSSVLAPLKYLETQGFTVKLVSPDLHGNIDPDRLLELVDSDTILLSCMLVNSEIGSMTDIAAVAKRAKRMNSNLLVHTDAVQAFCKIPFSTKKLGVDLLSVSSHKIHAPKGCGALYIRRGLRILPILYGGGQQGGIRPGTENVPAACAFAAAAKKLSGNQAQYLSHVGELREYFVNSATNMDAVCINSPQNATPYICNISVPGYRSEILLHYLAARGIYISSGSACAGGAKSHVLTSMGLSAQRLDSALRISFCKDNTIEDIQVFFEVLSDAVQEIARA